MKKEKELFLTEEFYNNRFLTLAIANTLLADKQIKEKDVYADGTILFVDVYNNDKTNKILSHVINDFDKYKEFNDSNFENSKDESLIDLSGLFYLHSEYFTIYDEIMWDNESERFELRCVIENDED